MLLVVCVLEIARIRNESLVTATDEFDTDLLVHEALAAALRRQLRQLANNFEWYLTIFLKEGWHIKIFFVIVYNES